MRRAPLIFLLALAACIPQAGGSVRAERVPRALPGARTGGTLRVGITPPDGIDPTSAHEPSGELIVQTMCDQLIALDPITGAPRPSLARSWQIGDGGRSLFVKLRPGARFSDGEPVTAEDVQFTLSHLANQQYASPSAALLQPVAGFGFVHGEVDTTDEELRRTLIGARIVDAATVQITLEQPNADFYRVLAEAATTPVPRKLVEHDQTAFARTPACAGPYKLAETPKPGAPIRLVRVPGYPGANASLTHTGLGYADEIDFVSYASRAAAVAAFRRGDVDVAPLPEADRRAAPAGARIAVQAGAQTEYVGFPTTTAPFGDPRLRAALSLALDRTALAAGLFGDRRVPASTFLPAQFDAEPASCARNAPVRANLARARTLLNAALRGAPLRFTFSFDDEFANRALVTAVVRQWQQGLGAQVKLRPMTWAAYQELVATPQGAGTVFRDAWMPPYASATQIFQPLFTVNGIGKDNWSLYSSRDVNDALRDATTQATDLDRARDLHRAHEILCDDMPMLPLLHDARAYLLRANVGSAIGAIADAWAAQPILRELYLRASS